MKFQLPVFALILTLVVAARLGILLKRPADLATDPDGYIAHAALIAEGKGFVGPSTMRPTAFRPPGFAYLIAWWPGSASDVARSIAMMHIAAGVATVLLTRQLAEEVGLGPLSSSVAAAIIAVDPLLIRYTALPMTEVTSGLSLTAALIVLVRFRKQLAKASIDACYSHLLPTGAAAGVLLGLSTLIRPVGLAAGGLLTLDFLLLMLRSRGPGQSSAPDGSERGSLVRRSGIALIPATTMMLTLSPWIIRNWLELQSFVPATTHGGYTLALGNNPDYYADVVRKPGHPPWDGARLDAWQQKMTAAARQAGVPEGDEVANDQFMYQRAKQAITDHPQDFIVACWLRIRSFWALSPALPVGGLPAFLSLLCQFWYGGLWLLLCTAAIGLIRKSTTGATFGLWLTILAFQIVHSIYWTDTRMRAPVMPVIAVIAASTLKPFGLKNDPSETSSAQKCNGL